MTSGLGREGAFAVGPFVVRGALDTVYRICVRCVMDTSDTEITFDDEGYCNHCVGAVAQMTTKMPAYTVREYRLERIVSRLEAARRGRPYRCIVRVTGR